MSTIPVQIIFNPGANQYIFPVVQDCKEPVPAAKDTVIEGVRADGSIVIPGGKRSQEITIRGILFNNAGFEAITDAKNDMITKVTTSVTTLQIQHWNGSTWEIDNTYTVKRINEIEFDDSLRTVEMGYTVRFFVISF
jgi:hypothetical protein